MKLSLKKSAGKDSLKTLDEKEIQRRLYGQYHREGVNSKKETGSIKTAEAPELKPILKTDSGTDLTTELWSVLWGSVRAAALQFKQKFPWKFAAVVTGLLIASVFLFELLSFWLTQPAEESTLASEGKFNESIVSQPLAEKIVPGKGPLTPADSGPVQAGQIQTEKKKYYAVQVCTYQREADAQQLTNELRQMNFPAFYKQFVSSQQRIFYYVVFLAKEENYAQASSRLSQFRKTKQFQIFPDAFIRSL